MAKTRPVRDGRPLRITAPMQQRSLDALGGLTDRRYNFALQPADRFTPENGWKVDDLCQRLPSEPPGPPVAGGAFEVACQLLDRYEMADPALVRAVYFADAPLDQRNMVLEGRFLFLRFVMPVRVGGTRDRSDTVHGRPVRIHGWCYRTLEGHLERGQMDWEVWKWLDTGEVEFRIHAFTQRGDITNPIVRLGFALFGHRTQEQFYLRVRQRMNRLVAHRLGTIPASDDPCTDVTALEGTTFGPEDASSDTSRQQGQT